MKHIEDMERENAQERRLLSIEKHLAEMEAKFTELSAAVSHLTRTVHDVIHRPSTKLYGIKEGTK